MLVGAPWDGPANNRKGDVYECVVAEERNSNCSKVNLGEKYSRRAQLTANRSEAVLSAIPGETAFQNISKNLKNSHLGMTLTPDTPDGFLVCGQRGFVSW